ncbi:MAG TPA: M3 family metallopeptidase, partial [Acidobacteriaceae bacterium]|nr:M3 family metallopeptidase [Acidobacteriaceae bacterium]
MAQVSVLDVTKAIHPWDGGELTAEILKGWVSDRLAASDAAIAALLAVEGQRTPENSLRLYDIALEQLNLAGAQAGVLNSVASEKAIRDQAQEEAQRVALAGTVLSLNRGVYDALAAVDVAGASEATRHFVEKTLLSYRLAGVDKDEATRKRLHELHEQATRLSLEFGRNIQEGAKSVTVESAEELEGLPADYLARHTPTCDGKYVLTTDQPDMQPVMTFAKSDSLRERMFLAYNTRAYPANGAILLELLKTRQEIATVLGFSSWANLATADQMMGSAANVRAFIGKLEKASREGAEREFKMVFDFAKERQPGLKEMNAASRGYWYEQYRRAAYDFDSQSVRPYFPYAQVEQGVLDTAAKLFGVLFQRSSVPGWHQSVSVFDVLDLDGETPIGRFYLDMHPREG